MSELLAGRLDEQDIGGHSRFIRIVGTSSCSLTVAASGNIPRELSVRLEDPGGPGMDGVAHPAGRVSRVQVFAVGPMAAPNVC